MDLSSAHMPYIIASYGLVIFIFISMTCWALSQDRKVRKQLITWKPDAT